MRWLVISLVCLFALPLGSAALGISPAIRSYDYVPGSQVEITYTIQEDDPARKVLIHVDGGPFADSIEISKTEVVGTGTFVLTLTFPEEAPPGPHRIGVVVTEAPPENAFIGTAISINARIDVFVPYPGRYIEPRLIIPNKNAGEDVPVELQVINRGLETLTVAPTITVTSLSNAQNNAVLDFTPVTLVSNQEQYFRKYLETATLPAGDYFAEAVIAYAGEERRVNDTFSLGELSIAVVNTTSVLYQDGLQRYHVYVESGWNDPIDDVYADLALLRDGVSLETMRTPPVDIGPWKTEQLEAFVDTGLYEPGEYEMVITVQYAGQQTTVRRPLTIRTLSNNGVVYGILIVVGILIVLGYVLLRYHNAKKTKNYRKTVKSTDG